MGVSTRSIGSTLAEIVGRERVSGTPEVTAAAAIDGATPMWVVRPATVEQVAQVLVLASDEDLAVGVRGSGSTLELGHPPARVDLVLDTSGLDRVLEDHPEDLTVSVEAGLRAGVLAERLEARGQWLPVDPPGWRSRTLGGLAATNATGSLRVRYGAWRDLLLGVRFVQADGVVTWGGARVVKSVTGYDMPKLIVGSLGTLGVVVEMTLRLHPRPATERTWLIGCERAGDAQDVVAAILDSTLQPTRVELLDTPALRACEAPPSALGVAVAIGSVEAAVREQGALLERLARHAGGTVTDVTSGFWDRYDATCAPGASDAVLHVASLASRLGETLGAIRRASEDLGDDAATLVVGNAALASLRVVVTGGESRRIAGMVERLRGAMTPIGGTVVIVQSPRDVRVLVDPWGPVEPAALGLMRAVKETFDPKRRLNAGRFVGGL